MRQSRQRQPPSYMIRARAERIREYARSHGWDGDSAMGRAFGMSRQATWAVLSGTNAPSAQFIAGVMQSSPDARFDDLFEVVADPRSTDVPQ